MAFKTLMYSFSKAYRDTLQNLGNDKRLSVELPPSLINQHIRAALRGVGY